MATKEDIRQIGDYPDIPQASVQVCLLPRHLRSPLHAVVRPPPRV